MMIFSIIFLIHFFQSFIRLPVITMDFKHFFVLAFSNISLIWNQNNFPITNQKSKLLWDITKILVNYSFQWHTRSNLKLSPFPTISSSCTSLLPLGNLQSAYLNILTGQWERLGSWIHVSYSTSLHYLPASGDQSLTEIWHPKLLS